MNTKTMTVDILDTTETKAADGKPLGMVKVLFSRYDVVDFDGDVTRRGSFEPLIAKVNGGQPIPYVFSHNSWSIENYLGTVTTIEDTDDGPVATAQLLLDDPAGAKAYALMASGALREHSYQYETKAAHFEELDGQKVRVLDSLDAFEIGPCLRGANDQTDVIDVKTGQPLPRGQQAAGEIEPAGAGEKANDPRAGTATTTHGDVALLAELHRALT